MTHHHLGPGPVDVSETASAASPVGATVGRDFGARGYVRPLTGLVTVLAICAVIALTVALFRGSLADTVPVTVISDRAGLVMNPDARVKLRDIQVGKVSSIESLPNGQAALHLAMDPSQMQLIPSNVAVDITSATVFGAKSVEFTEPAEPSPEMLRAGQTIQAQHVTVEVNTVFDRLTVVLRSIQPEKINQVLGAFASALNDRGEKLGQALDDLDSLLATMEPSLPTLSHEFAIAPQVLQAYGEASPHLVATLNSASTISQTIVDQQRNLDAFLVSMIGLADVGNQVLSDNRQGLTNAMRVLVPTTDLLNRYHAGLNCALSGAISMAGGRPFKYPGVDTLASFLFGAERYRYPDDLPKVAAKGGPPCQDLGLPNLAFEQRPPYVVADIGANPFKYGNQQLVQNYDPLKQWLFGPIPGPPRNSSQIGQPG